MKPCVLASWLCDYLGASTTYYSQFTTWLMRCTIELTCVWVFFLFFRWDSINPIRLSIYRVCVSVYVHGWWTKLVLLAHDQHFWYIVINAVTLSSVNAIRETLFNTNNHKLNHLNRAQEKCWTRSAILNGNLSGSGQRTLIYIERHSRKRFGYTMGIMKFW